MILEADGRNNSKFAYEDQRLSRSEISDKEPDQTTTSKLTSNKTTELEVSRDYRMDEIIRFIEANYFRSISIRDLAREAKLSKSRLCFLFKAEVGVSPMRYLKQVRIREAEQLLMRDRSLCVKELAAKVGVNDRSHFARDFKQVFGISPGEYKRRRIRIDPVNNHESHAEGVIIGRAGLNRDKRLLNRTPRYLMIVD